VGGIRRRKKIFLKTVKDFYDKTRKKIFFYLNADDEDTSKNVCFLREKGRENGEEEEEKIYE